MVSSSLELVDVAQSASGETDDLFQLTSPYCVRYWNTIQVWLLWDGADGALTNQTLNFPAT